MCKVVSATWITQVLIMALIHVGDVKVGVKETARVVAKIVVMVVVQETVVIIAEDVLEVVITVQDSFAPLLQYVA